MLKMDLMSLIATVDSTYDNETNPVKEKVKKMK